jgi:hypothetical protein
MVVAHIAIAATAGSLLIGCAGTPSSPTDRSSQPSIASFVLTGTVRESRPNALGAPIEGAEVQVRLKVGTGPAVVTNAEGRYRIDNIASPNFEIVASKDGFESGSLVVVGANASELNRDLALTPIARTLEGFVTESAPTETAPIAGATVQIMAGAQAGTRVQSDSRGFYRFSNLWGNLALAVSRDGFEPKTVEASMTQSITRLNVSLLPDGSPTTTSLQGRVCSTNPPTPAGACLAHPRQTHHWLPIHRPGPVTIALETLYNGDYSAEFTRLEIRCGAAVIVDKRFVTSPPPFARVLVRAFPQPEMTPTLAVSLATPCMYEVKIADYFADHKGIPGLATDYRLTLQHPK